jgi:signal transduction histidine kinase
VSDRGIGLPKSFDKTLDSIATTKDKREHSGLGLLTSRRALRSMGGQLEVLPRVGGGVTFVAVWPSTGDGDADTAG